MSLPAQPAEIPGRRTDLSDVETDPEAVRPAAGLTSKALITATVLTAARRVCGSGSPRSLHWRRRLVRAFRRSPALPHL